jgi:hypothetical protein
MTLQEKLDAFKAQFESGAPPYNATPEVVEIMHRATNELRNSGILERVLKVGDRAPAFTLPNPQGEVFSSLSLLVKGPLVVDFYRGVW